ncbi:Alpha/beta_hydrolase family protein [Hexamita inflata]|uniref:Alpha/beta hydrolase family protein n=1 Tax=Hexamita inflata TaxID=28002 RepID=A0AA86TLD9_9EUKA|nr:Alpha/beta hydrolase family protein [Hexamita inflata]
MRLQRLSLGVSLAFSISFIVRHIKNVRNYKISQCLCSDSKLSSIVNKINDENIIIPSKPQKIQPPKPVYIRQSFTYSYDVNDTFYYDVLQSQHLQLCHLFVDILNHHVQGVQLNNFMRMIIQSISYYQEGLQTLSYLYNRKSQDMMVQILRI